MTRTLARILLVVAAGTPGCFFDLAPCSSDDDCSPGMVCAQPLETDVPYCVLAPAEPDGGMDQPDGAPPEPDASQGDPPDAEATVDLPPPDRYCGEGVECVSDSSFGEDLLEGPVGCFGDGFVEETIMRREAVCDDEGGRHRLDFVRCRQFPYQIEVVFDFGRECLDDTRASVSGEQCNEGPLKCESRGATYTFRYRVPSTSFTTSVESLTFVARTAVDVDYDVRVSVSKL